MGVPRRQSPRRVRRNTPPPPLVDCTSPPSPETTVCAETPLLSLSPPNAEARRVLRHVRRGPGCRVRVPGAAGGVRSHAGQPGGGEQTLRLAAPGASCEPCIRIDSWIRVSNRSPESGVKGFGFRRSTRRRRTSSSTCSPRCRLNRAPPRGLDSNRSMDLGFDFGGVLPVSPEIETTNVSKGKKLTHE